MATKKPSVPRKDALDIILGGEGVTPSSVGVRALAELLQAAQSVVEAVAKANGAEVPVVTLAEVRRGSAAYRLDSETEGAGRVFTNVYDLARTRGKGAPAEVHHALKRFHAEATKIGVLQLQATEGRRAPRRPILVAVPLDRAAVGVESYEDAYGRLVGLHLGRGQRAQIQVLLAEGRTEEFACDESLLETATALFGKPVRARAVYSRDGSATEPLTVQRLEPWGLPDQDAADALDAMRAKLEAQGVELDSTEWLKWVRGNG